MEPCKRCAELEAEVGRLHNIIGQCAILLPQDNKRRDCDVPFDLDKLLARCREALSQFRKNHLRIIGVDSLSTECACSDCITAYALLADLTREAGA